MSLGVHITGLTKDELKELMLKVREIEQRDPSRLILAMVVGMDQATVEEARKMVIDIMPKI